MDYPPIKLRKGGDILVCRTPIVLLMGELSRRENKKKERKPIYSGFAIAVYSLR